MSAFKIAHGLMGAQRKHLRMNVSVAERRTAKNHPSDNPPEGRLSRSGGSRIKTGPAAAQPTGPQKKHERMPSTVSGARTTGTVAGNCS